MITDVHAIADGPEGVGANVEPRHGRVPRTLAGAGLKITRRVNIAEAKDVPPNGLRVYYRVVIEIEGGQRPA